MGVDPGVAARLPPEGLVGPLERSESAPRALPPGDGNARGAEPPTRELAVPMPLHYDNGNGDSAVAVLGHLVVVWVENARWPNRVVFLDG